MSVSDSQTDAERLELAWELARLDALLGEVMEGLFEADEEVL